MAGLRSGSSYNSVALSTVAFVIVSLGVRWYVVVSELNVRKGRGAVGNIPTLRV
jgi:hypothetical protein